MNIRDELEKSRREAATAALKVLKALEAEFESETDALKLAELLEAHTLCLRVLRENVLAEDAPPPDRP